MIACKQCGRLYDDKATYCNQCQLDLTEADTDWVVDQQEYETFDRSQLFARKKLLRCLTVVGILGPFYIYFIDAIILSSATSKLVYLLLVQAFVGLSLWCGYKQKTGLKFFAWGTALLWALLLPLGLVVTLVLAFLLLNDER